MQVRANNAETDHTDQATDNDSPWSDTGSAITTAGGVTRSVPENSGAGTNVGAAVTASNTTYTYSHSLSGTDASKFEIGSSTGQITVKTGTTLDYESGTTSYSVIVTVTAAAKSQGANAQSLDPNAPGSYTVPVTINVTDVLEPPAAPTVTASANSTTPTSKIDASWTPPSMTGKPAIDGYDVRYKKSDDSTWTMHKFSGVVTATRGSDGTTASVSWTEYDGSDFDYYRVIVCTADNFSTTGPTCSSAAFTGSAINSSGTTTQAVTGLTAATGYGVILQLWFDDSTNQKLYVQMAANSERYHRPGNADLQLHQREHRQPHRRQELRRAGPRPQRRGHRPLVGHGQRHHPGRPQQSQRPRRRNPQRGRKLRRRNQRGRGGNGHQQHQQLHAHPRVERNGRRQVRDCQRHRADYREVGNQPGLRIGNHLVQRHRDGQGRRGRR